MSDSVSDTEGELVATEAVSAVKLVDLVDRAAVTAILDAWWMENMPGSSLGRATEAWNHVYAAFERLKRDIGRM